MIIEVLNLHTETHCVSINNQTINIIYSYWQIVALCLKNYRKHTKSNEWKKGSNFIRVKSVAYVGSNVLPEF